VMWVCPGFTASNIRMAALDRHGHARGGSVLDEGSLMPAAECAAYILRAIARRRRTLVLTLLGKVTVLINKVAPALADRLTYRHYYNRKGEFVK
jgi:short-subunit dehydrogenase